MARIPRLARRLLIVVAVLFAAAVACVQLFPDLVVEATMRLERGRADLEAKSVEVGDHTIVYLEARPDAARTILMVHGFSADKDNWTRFARFFEDDHVVALDLPGFGESTRDPHARYDIASQADRLAAFTDAIGLGPHDVVGNSMGGNLVGAYAAKFPGRVKSVAFFANSGITAPTPSPVMEARARGEHPLLVSSVEDYERVVDLVFVERPFLPDAVLRHFAQRAVDARAFNEKIGEDLAERPLPLEPVLEAIRVPTLILWGADDRVLDVSAIEIMQPRLPHAVVIVMEACGHLPMLERPEEAAGHYARFLRSAAAARPGD